jgi:hypothetical protein
MPASGVSSSSELVKIVISHRYTFCAMVLAFIGCCLP